MRATIASAWRGLSLDEGQDLDAIRQAIEAVQIAGETGDLRLISSANESLALVQLFVGDLRAARAAAEAARAHDVPRNNHNVQALLGLIALRQGDHVAAAEAFSAAIAHAKVIHELCDQNYDVLDAKGLALTGLAVLEGGRARPRRSRRSGPPGRLPWLPGSSAACGGCSTPWRRPMGWAC